MAEMLLINPAHRPKRRRPAKKSKASHRRKARRTPSAVAAFSPVRHKRRARRANPIRALRRGRHARRRRNPISLGRVGGSSIKSTLMSALTMGAGAIGVDALWGFVNPKLPAAMRTSANGVGAGDVVKLAATLMLGRVLRRPTKGLSEKLALGALVTQVRDIGSAMLPASVQVAGLGYFTPGRVIDGTARVGPNQSVTRGVSPLLNKYTRPGVTPLLNAAAPGTPSAFRPSTSRATAMREGVRFT